MRLLLDEQPTDGNGNPPPSAAAVLAGTITEADLRRELEQAVIDRDVARAEKSTTASQKEKLERDIAYLQDELNRLKQTPAPAAATPAAAPAAEEASWIDTFVG